MVPKKMKDSVIIVNKESIVDKTIDSLNIENIIGQKAYGLCLMPWAWTLPFFVIDNALVKDVLDNNLDGPSLLKCVDNIKQACRQLGIEEELIIRSSGIKEGMSERGQYESQVGSINTIMEDIKELIKKININSEIKENGISLVVQKYVSANLMGHLSNEYRYSKDTRDFVCEYLNKKTNVIESDKIGLRNYRATYDINQFSKNTLSLNKGLTEALRIAAAFYYYNRKRVHIEFVTDDNNLYLVQCDQDIESEDRINPENIDISMSSIANFVPEALKKVSIEDKDKGYNKIDNLFIYQAVGETIPPIYILDNIGIIRDLEKGIMNDNLVRDLEKLTRQSLVIRTNIISASKEKGQLSPRSTEIRTLEKACEFLKSTSKKFLDERINNYIYIFHNFIPSKAAAFVDAIPMDRIVEIQALWGLPEGLYYNSHDRYIVDTKVNNYENMQPQRFTIKKYPSYKDTFVVPNMDGEWITKKISYNKCWGWVIPDDGMIKDIALRSRKIAEKCQKEVSIMWFVGVDEDFYPSASIPWYHEDFDRNTYYYTDRGQRNRRYKKKYFFEKELVIETEDDINQLKQSDAKRVGIVKIQPISAELLRNKEFINKIGNICKEKEIGIYLEGAALAHSYYQLLKTGANVLNSHDIKEYDEEIEFNKLVRDKIPEHIKDNGENVIFSYITGDLLINEIKRKIIEESYEVFDAESRDDIIEELADLKEICMTLQKEVNSTYYVNELPLEKIPEIEYVFEYAVPIKLRQSIDLSINDIPFRISFERTEDRFQLDLYFGKRKFGKSNEYIEIDQDKKAVLVNAFNISKANNGKSINDCLNLMTNYINSIVNKKNVNSSTEEIEKIRLGKLKKRGGFEKGYILKSTSYKRDLFSDYWEENIDDIRTGQDIVETYSIPVRDNIDIEALADNGLLVRVNFQMNCQNHKWKLSNKNISNIFPEVERIDIFERIVEDKIRFEIQFVKREFYQMSLDNIL